MEIFLGQQGERDEILECFPHTKQALGNDGILIVAKNDSKFLGFLWAFIREIPLTDSQTELFINVIEVFDAENRCSGIGSLLVKKCIETAQEKHCYQIRAYCDSGNIPSIKLWIKNGFTVSPVKMPNSSIPGAYVSFKISSSVL